MTPFTKGQLQFLSAEARAFLDSRERRPPLGLKQPKAKPDPQYLARVRELPCCVCVAFGEIQIGPTYAHHTICGRYSQEKVPDRMAIPLCYAHHQGDKGIHTDKSAWVAEYGDDRNYIAATQDKLLK